MNRDTCVALLCGIGLGVGAAILYTSESGRQARSRVGTKVNETTEELKRRGEELKNAAAGFVQDRKVAASRIRERVEDVIDAGKQAYAEAQS